MKFYMHAGCLNHGCEAIVRSTLQMLDVPVELFSEHPEEDVAVHLDDVCTIELQGGKRSKTNPFFVLCKGAEVALKKKDMKHWYAYKNLLGKIKPGELCLSIGGDNYCYGANPYLVYLNRAICQRGGETGLWGCSIEPEVLKAPEIVEDMKRYSFISARESITYQALKDAGLKNIYLYPDPAFTLETKVCDLPSQFESSGVVGLNLSPLVQKLDKSGKMVLDNYIELVRYILKETELNIALIPHVCKPGNDDRDSMKALASHFPEEDRIVMVNTEGTMDCRELKYIISKCKFVVTARTHASIAAYSTCVPTLVVGYSVKARGIAKDLFGTDKNYVLNISEMYNSSQLKEAYKWLANERMNIKVRMGDQMPKYIECAREAKNLILGAC